MRFNTVHQNFLANISDYNAIYDNHVTANYDKGMDYFFAPDTHTLNPKYAYLDNSLSGIAGFAELLVKLAQELSAEIKAKHQPVVIPVEKHLGSHSQTHTFVI